MNRLHGSSLFSLIIGLLMAAFVVPWALSSLNRSKALLDRQQEITEATRVPRIPAPSPEELAATRQASEARIELAKSAKAQAARTQKSMARVAVRPMPVVPAITPSYSIVPPGSPRLSPLEGWNDQPKKSKPGKVHSELMLRTSARAKPRVAGRAPCMKRMRYPAHRIQLSYGWVDVHERVISVACSSR